MELEEMIAQHKQRVELKKAMEDAGLSVTLWALEDYAETIAYHESSLTPLDRDKDMTNEAKIMAIRKILR